MSTKRIPSNGFSASSRRYSILASRTLRVRKYAAKFRLVDHAGAHQRFYLRFLCVKRPVWSGFPEFAAYFRFENSEVRGKTGFRQPDPGYTLSRPAVLTPKFGLCSAGSDFSPHFRKWALWLWFAWQEKHREKGNQAAAGSLGKRYGFCGGCKPLPDEVCQTQLALGDFRKTPVFPGGGRKRIDIPIIS